MLGRFVVGGRRVDELRTAVRALGVSDDPWPVSVVCADFGEAAGVLESVPKALPDDLLTIESVETKVWSEREARELAARAGTRELYIEAALDSELEARLDVIQRAGARAKIRTGGTTESAFPAATDVLRFIRACAERDLAFKATAGLHHPLRGTYRLTYDADAKSGPMFGFLNIFLAALLVRQGITDTEALALLGETGAASITIDEDVIEWKGRRITAAEIAAGRMRFATSFGSCSFREPVDELPWRAAAVA
jgi:hypothetical protein